MRWLYVKFLGLIIWLLKRKQSELENPAPQTKSAEQHKSVEKLLSPKMKE